MADAPEPTYLADLRALAASLPNGEATACFVGVGGPYFSDVFGADQRSIPGAVFAIADRFADVYTMNSDRDGAPALWGVARVRGDHVEVLVSYDDFPPSWLVQRWGKDLDNPAYWLAHAEGWDRRPASALPQWWKDKLASIGAWDSERDALAVKGDGNPLHGPRIFGPRKDRS